MRVGRGFRNFVPNNDLDTVAGDPRRIAKIRAPKFTKPVIFNSSMSLLYAWQFEEGENQAKQICCIAERLYQLGRGVDMAWAWGEIIETLELYAQLEMHGGVVHRPNKSGLGRPLLCPQSGSLASLDNRFKAMGKRFRLTKVGRQAQQLFTQPPKPRFVLVSYDSPTRLYLFELRQSLRASEFVPYRLAQASALVETLRDRGAERLSQRLPSHAAMIERVFIGRGANEADKATRIRIIPLPSIGSPHVVPSIRRVLVEIPPDCPIRADDIAWSFSGLAISEQVNPETGEVVETILVSTDELGMLAHYGIGRDSRASNRMWRTVTPAVLPLEAVRRRIDRERFQRQREAAHGKPDALLKEAKAGSERVNEESRAAAAVVQACRHAGVSVRPEVIRVQREPFESRGARAEAFANGTRFSKERLWHVEITFADGVLGPLLIGDGRYLGLGLLAPVRDATRDTLVFSLSSKLKIRIEESSALVEATRRALMSLSRDSSGSVPRLFSGHEADGAPAASGKHDHVFLVADDADGDGYVDRLIIVAPWACDHSARSDRKTRNLFEDVVSRLETVRAGQLGIIELGRPSCFSDSDPMLGPARIWNSRTPYLATRHAGRRKDAREALFRDVMTECIRRDLPKPEVTVLNYAALPNGRGLSAKVQLRFATAIRGPLLLGRNSHKGGGLFAAEGRSP
jgi:CRISPR-associated protein Csb2